MIDLAFVLRDLAHDPVNHYTCEWDESESAFLFMSYSLDESGGHDPATPSAGFYCRDALTAFRHLCPVYGPPRPRDPMIDVLLARAESASDLSLESLFAPTPT